MTQPESTQVPRQRASRLSRLPEDSPTSPRARARAIALYLPQFHPIPENDEWWGPGFTEWTNVARGRPLFRGHVQPQIPGALGFYDLRLPEVREEQAELARQAGIEAFCYWHYWFGDGRRILERPFAEVLESGTPTFTFCLGWANESWTGIWHGAADRVLMEQRYPGHADSAAHFTALLPAFEDDRYFRVEGRPLFHVYRPGDLPSAAQFVDEWQQMAREAGLPGLYLVAGVNTRYRTYAEDGFDAAFWPRLPYVAGKGLQLATRWRKRVMGQPLIRDYAREPLYDTLPGADPRRLQPCVVTNWDNTPRSGKNGVVLMGATPERLRVHVRSAIRAVEPRPAEERIVWLKSWNEWAEGNYLEPDAVYGDARLRVLREELVDVGE